MEFFSNLTPRRRLALLFAVLWLAAASFLLLPSAFLGRSLHWAPAFVLLIFCLHSFSGAAVLAEVMRGLVPYFSQMNDEKHFFWVLVIFGCILALMLSGYLLGMQQ